ncbi:MAG: GGDEF domain-containing protein [Alphaproteobacteria bacterium]|nr:GGDEF domain-containing protein [Alphaproteobacteria bacterium]MBU1514179.1 GGDEF domain-containing protein [Alphaproteobacteria bacterium]MBU2096172.1 GGDEF domain-containing protein [Alphaproteobacteria bacterium]MBU2151126.1 GGDEF domain-containing protein [Alphaproteobacteria bacterium]MBU2307215.1 GGDEF domain-containing protein [Alphaproteobacteria bacterium]
MKIGGARSEPIAADRRRVVAPGVAATSTAAQPVDSATFLGISRSEMTPAVQAAIRTLLGELDELKSEVNLLKARLDEAEGLADRDALTPLLNRRAFVRELSRARTAAQRYGFPLSLVYFDLDGFKGLNDRLGHAAGDAALQAVAERLSANVRDSDVVGRMGGDEFAVVLVQADQATAEAKAATLAQAIEHDIGGDEGARLRVSYGVREINSDVEPEALIAEADAAMFEAKRLRKAG